MRDNEKVRQLYKEYQRKDITRAERREMLEKIARERYKTDPRKSMSVKGQALMNLLLGALMMAHAVIALISRTSGSIRQQTPLFLSAIAVYVVLLFIMGRYKKEPEDELSKDLKLKADAYTAHGLIVATMVYGIVLQTAGNHVHKVSITGEMIMWFGYLMIGTYHVLRNAIYLRLDRTPESEEEA
ncbi:hypothetical protein [Ruminococcus albus]|uniref:Uncharacterized protein n=1 Tax=Ruminococcus albus (strain ATCC 27210 / DSM 20455 / JCM 14654 / NCDO 2250 / 7) TaxID=697329 RepID=E6UDS4_RUMA7|nr:hypothetical protein [Ruminococcus albus]ADU20902.1 hypothetical protein Rumal_0345 [Ruminococcus albus 7 = DSM 20455]